VRDEALAGLFLKEGDTGAIFIVVSTPQPSTRFYTAATPFLFLASTLLHFLSTLYVYNRPWACRLADKPKTLPPTRAEFERFMNDDDLLLEAAHAAWVLVPVTSGKEGPASHRDEGRHSAVPVPGELLLGRCAGEDGFVTTLSCSSSSSSAAAAASSAVGVGAHVDPSTSYCVVREQHKFFIRAPSSASSASSSSASSSHMSVNDMGEAVTAAVNGQRIPPGGERRIFPGDDISVGGKTYHVKQRHLTMIAANSAPANSAAAASSSSSAAASAPSSPRSPAMSSR
jgi:hypothetical protein